MMSENESASPFVRSANQGGKAGSPSGRVAQQKTGPGFCPSPWSQLRMISPTRCFAIVLPVLPSLLASVATGDGPRPSFAVIALPDTQNYSKSYPQTFTAQTQWIVNQQTALNIVFVTHLGDIVQDGDEPWEWANASASMSVLEGSPRVPYGLCVGNHDEEPREDPDGTLNFNLYFPYTRYAGQSWYGGHYESDNDNSYQLFSGSGLDFVIVHLEFDPDSNPIVLDWADNVLKTHPERRAIISSHDLLSKTVPNAFSSHGQQVYDRLKGNPNLFLMVCGHCSDLQEGRRADTYEGRTVYTLLSDYQDRSHGGDGWLRIMKFRPDYDEIQVYTYSPTLDRFETDDNSQFTLEYDMGAIDTVEPDLDRDGDVDMADFGVVQACLTGPYDPVPEDCRPTDLDHDGHVNAMDLSVLLQCLGGPGLPAEQGCDSIME